MDNDQLILQSLPPVRLLDRDVSGVPDVVLADSLCRRRAISPLPCSNDNILLVECLVPLRAVATSQLQEQQIIVRRLDDEEVLTVLLLALVSDCLLGAVCDRLLETCSWPKRVVRSTDYYTGSFFPESTCRGIALEWKLTTGGQEG